MTNNWIAVQTLTQSINMLHQKYIDTNYVSFKLICAFLNVQLCTDIFKITSRSHSWRRDEIWAVDSQEITKFVATRCQISSLK